MRDDSGFFRDAGECCAHFKGGKGDTLMRKQEDAQGKILQLTLPVGSSIGQHVHEDSYEVMYILSGSGVCYDEGRRCVCCRECATTARWDTDTA